MHDTPTWSHHTSYRGQQYRYLSHQSGTIGMFTIKLLSITPHPPFQRGSRCYLTFSVGGASRSTRAFDLPCDDARDCTFNLPLPKGAFGDGLPVAVEVEAHAEQGLVTSFLSSSPPLGRGGHTLTGLALGASSVLDVDLSLPPLGTARFLVAYKPHGIPPRPGDVVCLESFCRFPSSVVLPPSSPLQVLAASDSHLHLSYRLPSGRSASVRVHRNAVFVIERLTPLDGLWNLALTPSDLLLSTRLGSRAVRAAKPIVAYAEDVARPAVFGAKVAMSAGRTTVRAVVEGAVKAGKTAAGVESPAKF